MDTTSAQDDPDVDPPYGGWLFLQPEHVPPRWRDRVIPMALVPLLPQEAAAVLDGRAARDELPANQRQVAPLVARGLPARDIARQLGTTERSVYRHLADLRDRFGVQTTNELIGVLARRGF